MLEPNSPQDISSLSTSLLGDLIHEEYLLNQKTLSWLDERDSGHYILGIGCDIIEIDRFRGAVERTKGALLSKVFTPIELDILSQLKDPYPSLAARFAAKEALSKALGCGIGESLAWIDMEIVKDERGKPIVVWSERALSLFPISETHISLSHSKQMALAFTIIKRRD